MGRTIGGGAAGVGFRTTRRGRLPGAPAAWAAVLAAAISGLPRASVAAEPVDYGPDVRALTSFLRAETERLGIPCLSIALVDDQRVVWEQGFGFRDAKRTAPAGPETVYRVGSISKLFTAVLVMQLVERGALDLDAPITKYAPELVFRSPFPETRPITLRLLLSHRAGIARESAVGSYFDPTEPGIERTVRSFVGSDLVYPPGERTKYSNLGPTLAGYIIEKATGKPFAEHARTALLDPLGMASSSFLPDREPIRENLADAWMVDFDGRFFPAPTFALGTIPAGNLYSTVSDLARFLRAIFAGGELEGRRVLRRESLDRMFAIEPAGSDATSGFGLGFSISRFAGRRTVSHNGAVYGFASALVGLPEEKLGVIVLNDVDCANGFDEKALRKALGLMLTRKLGAAVPPLPEPVRLEASRLEEYAGDFAGPGRDARFFLDGGALRGRILGVTQDLVPLGADAFLVDGRLGYGGRVEFVRDGEGRVRSVRAGGATLERTVANAAVETPAAWARLEGDYGWPHNILRIRSRDGRLVCLVEWFFEYPLTPVDGLRFRFPDYGLYENEALELVERDGSIVAAKVGPVSFPRR